LLKNLIIVLMFSLSIELFQYLEMYFQVAIRMVDINDIILNVLGGGIGYYIYIFHYLRKFHYL
ncbi:VanZ family protein, partial [Clostridium perfringens]